MTIKDLLLHMAEEQYVAIFFGQKKEFEGKASVGILQLPNCLLNSRVKQIGSVDYGMRTKDESMFDYSVITIVAEV